MESLQGLPPPIDTGHADAKNANSKKRGSNMTNLERSKAVQANGTGLNALASELGRTVGSLKKAKQRYSSVMHHLEANPYETTVPTIKEVVKTIGQTLTVQEQRLPELEEAIGRLKKTLDDYPDVTQITHDSLLRLDERRREDSSYSPYGGMQLCLQRIQAMCNSVTMLWSTIEALDTSLSMVLDEPNLLHQVKEADKRNTRK